METIIRTLGVENTEAMWRINEQGLPGVGEVSKEQIADLLSLCDKPLGAFRGGDLAGFVLCLLPGTRYASLNYAWFNERYRSFLYVDRIAVATHARDAGVGSALYERVKDYADGHAWPVAAEVSLEPPNAGSLRFHGRHGFGQVGVLSHPKQRVSMMLRAAVS